MRDCVDLLPPLLQLNEAAKTGNSPSTVEVKKALAVYESKMIDRAFAWVQKSGGASMPVGFLPDSSVVFEKRQVSETFLCLAEFQP